MSISLYRKYRPQTFSEVIGQQHIVQTLSNAILHDRIGHAYLFTGPRGTGKTTMARIFAKAVNCQNKKGSDPCLTCDICKNIQEGKSLDIFEIDAASNTGVDNIRELRENVKFPPSQTKFKVYIIDEVHMLSTGAFNALLKTLEEPPAHVIFILATTEIHKVPETIISRCQRFDFTRLSFEHIIEKLSTVAKSEDVKIEKGALEMIAIAAEGGMRDAESLLSQVIALEDKNITEKDVEGILGTTKRQSVEEMVSNLLNKDLTSALTLIDKLSQDGYDLDVFHKALINYLRQLMLVCIDPKLAETFSFELTSEQTTHIISEAKQHKPQEIVRMLNCFMDIQGKIKSAFISQLPLEIATVKAILNIQDAPALSSIPATPAQAAPAPKANNPEPPQTFAKKEPSAPAPTITETMTVEHIEPKKEVIAEPATEVVQTVQPIEYGTNEFTLSDVENNWSAISREVMSLNHSLATMFPICKATKVEKNIITIATKYPFHKDKLKENTNQLTMEAAFAKILGSKVRINAVTMEEAGIKMAEKRPPSNGGNADMKPSETSSLLSDAMGIMGGQIVE